MADIHSSHLNIDKAEAIWNYYKLFETSAFHRLRRQVDIMGFAHTWR